MPWYKMLGLTVLLFIFFPGIVGVQILVSRKTKDEWGTAESLLWVLSLTLTFYGFMWFFVLRIK